MLTRILIIKNIKSLLLNVTLILLLSITNSFATTPNKTEKLLQMPASVPFDITKTGNKLDFKIEIKEKKLYAFELYFHYENPTRSKYGIVQFIKSWLPRKEYTQEELEVINKDINRVRRLIGTEELVEGKWIKYPGTPTPIKLKIILIKDEGEEVIFDQIKEPYDLSSGYVLHETIIQKSLNPGIYKIVAEVIKDSPEFIGTKIEFGVTLPKGKY